MHRRSAWARAGRGPEEEAVPAGALGVAGEVCQEARLGEVLEGGNAEAEMHQGYFVTQT